MKKYLFWLLLLFSTFASSQGIEVDTTALTIPQLVRNELMQNSCSLETNFLFSSHKGIGQFTNTNADFPISSGIILRNGIAKYTEGPYTGINESSQISTSVDNDLQTISDGNGQSGVITDVTFIQFDFTPLSSNLSFDFLFASNEYGPYQCGFSDVFAFLLTDLTTNVTTNLAVIPGTTTPVSVKNIRDATYNSSCLSSNANLFQSYNVNNSGSAINMRGETVLLNASSPVIPNRPYRIKLAIGDYNDSNFDSAVFIKGGSFTTKTDLGPDRTICQGENIILDTKLASQFNFAWTLNGNPVGGNTAKTTITQAGTYVVTATLPASGCIISDEVIISDLQTNTPNDLIVCNTGQPNYQYDLTQNNLVSLGINPAEYSIMYFATLANANANGPEIPVGQLSSYTSIGNQKIYIKATHISNGNAICGNLLSFLLLINPPVNATKPPDLNLCNTNSGIVRVNLTVQNPKILNGQNSASYTISYFTSQPDAQNNTNAIASPNAFSMNFDQSPKTIWARMTTVSSQSCFAVTNFDVVISPQPLVDNLANIIACSSYTLPSITNGNYYTGQNGTGTLLHAGNIISQGDTYYIFSGPISPNNCTNESSFKITLIEELTFTTNACGKYIIPATPAGNFFTESNGMGSLIPAGTQLTTSQIIHFYAVINGAVCRDDPFAITVFALPLVDLLTDILTCDSYTLPALTNGQYYTGANGSGASLNAGEAITSSQDIYVFANDGRCKNEHKFRVNIINTTIYKPINECGSYTLPAIAFGNYYDQPNGRGNSIPAGKIITSSQTVYYYAATSPASTCADNLNYIITINSLPPVDTPANQIECKRYTLPFLTNGNYYTQTNGGGTLLKAGDVIMSTQDIYIFADNGTCKNEYLFNVEIKLLPPVDSFTDVFTCKNFTLPTLVNGTYYTATGGPHGTGITIPTGTIISNTQIIYIYNESNDPKACSNETYFTVETSGVDVGFFSNINACDNYKLPLLSVGDYYSLPNGQGPIIPVGTILTISQTIYVYKKAGTRLTCSDEGIFTVAISITPVLIKQPDVESCKNYTLPSLPLGNYFSGPKGTGTSYLPGQIISTSQTMYIYAESPTNPNCFDQDNFIITIYPLNNLVIQGGAICVDFKTGALISSFELVSGLNPSIFTVEWYLNGTLMGTGTNYNATKEGTYDVTIIKNTADVTNNCSYNPTKVIVKKSSLAIATLTVTGIFENVIDIIVSITGGFGTYEYQMDNGAVQSDIIFHNVSSGKHFITIKDIKGDCGAIILVANVLKYPKFFTPNGDGFNDTWNIWALGNQPEDIIYIYDRFGKFIKQLSPAGQGWDGTYNGSPLPSTDYWFQVFYKNNDIPQQFKGHFSMKR